MMRKRKKGKILSLILTVCMLLGTLPADLFGGVAKVKADTGSFVYSNLNAADEAAGKYGRLTFTGTKNFKSGLSVTYQDMTLTSGLIMENGTEFSFESGAGTLILVTSDASKKIKVDEKNQSTNEHVLEMEIEAGKHTIAKNNPTNLVYIEFKASDTTADTYTVSVTGGSASPASAEAGQTVTVTADTLEGKSFKQWEIKTEGVTLGDDIDLTQSEITFVMPASNLELEAVYEDAVLEMYDLKVTNGTAADFGGNPITSQAAANTTVTITADPASEGKVFDKWIVNTQDVTLAGMDESSATTSFTMPKAAVEIEATYKDKAPEYTVTVTNGMADPATAEAGAIVTIKANAPDTGKIFDKWVVNTPDVTLDGINENASETSFTMPASDIAIEATYKEPVQTSFSFTKAEGYEEGAYAEWAPVDGANGYLAYVSTNPTEFTDSNRIDNELIREYADHWRVDTVGLSAGTYYIKVVAAVVDSSTKAVIPIGEAVTGALTVTNYDRSGFAFSSESKYKSGSGAYNDDGTLKAGAQVIYVTAATAKTCTAKLHTGGAAKDAVEVTGLQAILDGKQKSGTENDILDIRIIGCVSKADLDGISSSSEGLQVKGKNAYNEMNITLEGIGEDAAVKNFGFLVRNCGNVEFRNFAIMAFMDDGISIDTDNCNIWVHDMDIFYGSTGGDSDQAKGDGSIDMKAASTYITVSYTHFWDSGKCSLCGMSGDTAEFMATYHHNWFDHSDSRHARVRRGTVHIYNNYYDGNAKYGVGAANNSSIFVENNYFRNCNAPMIIASQASDMESGKSTMSNEDGGMIKAYNNHIEGANHLVYANAEQTTRAAVAANPTEFDAYLASSRDEQVPSSYKTVKGGNTYNNFDTSYDLGVKRTDDAEDVPAVVTAKAGRLNGGDFQWDLNYEGADEDYGVNAALKAAVVGYISPVKSVGGIDGVVNTTSPGTGEVDPPVEGTYKVTVTNGTASPANAKEGETVTLTASKLTGKEFVKWTVTSGTVNLANANSETTTFTMPASAVSVEAQYKDTTSSGTQLNGFELNVGRDLDVETYTTNKEKNGFTILADSTNTVAVDSNSKTVDNVTYTKRLKTGGEGTDTYRSVRFTTEEAAVVTVIAISSSGSATRTLGISDGTKDGNGKLVDLDTKSVGGANAMAYQFKLSEAGTYYLHSTSGGLNFYYIKVSYETTPDDNGNERVDDEVRERAPKFKAGDLYVSTKGTSAASGSFEDPMDLKTALNSIQAGNTIWMFSGTYYAYDMYGEPIIIEESNSGTQGALKTVSSINGKRVTIDFDGMAEEGANRGITLDGSYWHFYDIDICNAGDNGMLLSGDHNTLELCQFYGNHDTGLQLSRYNTSYATVAEWPSYNMILNCTAFNNVDEKTHENADGFAAKLTCGEGNVFDGCISYCNSDDGWDLYAKSETGPIGVVTIRNCIAFANGKLTDGTGSANGDMNGFKLGGSGVGTPHIVENCLAFNNGATGFTDNNNPTGIKLTNCTAVNNGIYDANKANFMVYRSSSDAVYTNLLSSVSKNGASTDQFKGTVSHSLYHYKDSKVNSGYYWVGNAAMDGSKTKYAGSEGSDYAVTDSDFINTTIPGYNAANSSYGTNYHTIFRREDGSIDVDNLFEVKKDSRLYTAGEGGTYIGAKFSVDGEVKTYTTSVTGGNAVPVKAKAGDTVTITAEPRSGMVFKKWNVKAGNVTLADAASAVTTFIMPTNLVEIEAEYEKTTANTPELDVVITGGSAKPAKAKAGETVTITAASAPEGKVFDKWVVKAGGVTLTDATRATTTFIMGSAPVELEVQYRDASANPTNPGEPTNPSTPGDSGNSDSDKPSTGDNNNSGSNDNSNANDNADNSVKHQSVTLSGKGNAKDTEPKTGGGSYMEIYATVAMIAGFAYLLSYFSEGGCGMTEEAKKDCVARLIRWAHQGGRCRRMIALVAIFMLLVYYHSIGKKTANWQELCEE